MRSAVQCEFERDSYCGEDLVNISPETLYALADRCLKEATKAGELFYELHDSTTTRIGELEALQQKAEIGDQLEVLS
ncbi:MAG: hypothetical protein H6968_11560 [Chromatiaceae bacterium]|nr:hypothetical protein [Chromatiaceae bacterium]